jgi:hypothetical protein
MVSCAILEIESQLTVSPGLKPEEQSGKRLLISTHLNSTLRKTFHLSAVVLTGGWLCCLMMTFTLIYGAGLVKRNEREAEESAVRYDVTATIECFLLQRPTRQKNQNIKQIKTKPPNVVTVTVTKAPECTTFTDLSLQKFALAILNTRSGRTPTIELEDWTR